MNRFIPLYSTQSGVVPAAGFLNVGELAVNVADGILYTKNQTNQVVQLTNLPIGLVSSSISSSFSTRTISSSHALEADSSISSSHALVANTVISASFATTASYISSVVASFPYDGTTTPAVISGSLIISGSTTQGLFVTGSTTVLGAFQATTKSFKIDHQRLPGKSLIYGVLEGPEHAVYARGKVSIGLTGTATIQLPDEWEWLVDEDSITVQLTSIGTSHTAYIESVNSKYLTIKSEHIMSCFYLVHATRKDVPTLTTVE